MIDAGANLEARTDLGDSPFLLAAANNWVSAGRLLAECGTDIYTTTDSGHNALKLARHFEHSEFEGFYRALRYVRDQEAPQAVAAARQLMALATNHFSIRLVRLLGKVTVLFSQSKI